MMPSVTQTTHVLTACTVQMGFKHFLQYFHRRPQKPVALLTADIEMREPKFRNTTRHDLGLGLPVAYGHNFPYGRQAVEFLQTRTV